MAGLAAAGWLVADGMEQRRPPTPGAVERMVSTGTPGVATRSLGPAEPTRIRIQRIGVDAPVVGVGLDGQGHLASPSDTDRNLAGWYRDGVAPGQPGTALVLGHVDTGQGPAVFWKLGALHRGDLIDLTRSDQRAAHFAVDAVEVYAKSGFPDDKVYGQTADAQLRLITCGGGFSKAHGYDGNVVVYAHLAAAD
ncbi:class F sortase [Kitasatospora sp. NPDC093558]|uniref:class F sortase n=1 Tax=Kitasatospora sp. NPDC093558 TaxID=3155201 RepID=UPI00341F7A7F